MSYVIRRNDDALLAKPASPGEAVRWVQWDEGVEPWTFVTRSGADKALAMHAHGRATVEPLEEVTYPPAPIESVTILPPPTYWFDSGLIEF